MSRVLMVVAAIVCAIACEVAYAAPISTGAFYAFRNHKGPNSVGAGEGDYLTAVVTNVSPNFTTRAFVTNPQVAGNPSLLNLFLVPSGFFSRSFAGDVSANPGSLTQPSTITLQNSVDSVDSLSVVTNDISGVQQLPLLNNLIVSGPVLQPLLSWDPVTTSVAYNQVRLSIYNDRTDQLVIIERNIGPAGTVNYAVPAGILAPNTNYTFRVFLWDGYGPGGDISLNRSSTFVNYTTTSSVFGVGSNFVTGPAFAPLTIAAGANNYSDTAMSIGLNNPGALTLTNGTTLAGSFVAVGNASFGTLVVDNTTVTLDGSAAVPPASGGFLNAGRGNFGRGFVDVINGGRIELDSNGYINPGLSAGRDATAFGNVNVVGAGSTIVITGPSIVSPTPSDNGVLNAGRIGDGRFNITGGGQIMNAAAGVTNIGRDTGSRGSILVSGNGSTLDAGSLLNIGFNAAPVPPATATGPGEGILRIEQGGLVRAGTTKLGPGGLLTGNGGTLQTAALDVSGGVVAPGSSPGTLTIDGDLNLDAGRLELEAYGPGLIDELIVTGAVAIGANAIIEVQLGYTPTAPLTFIDAGGGVAFDPGFAGPKVVGVLGTEAQGLDGVNVSIVIGDRTYEVAVEVPPIDPSVDYDGDGVPDGQDGCPGSSASATLMIGGCATGAANVFYQQGCKLSDATRACELAAHNHGAFVRCVAENANSWLENGLVSSRQRGAIQACAANY
jgi:T5SS/PEP-CTERM-associated repeat protein